MAILYSDVLFSHMQTGRGLFGQTVPTESRRKVPASSARPDSLESRLKRIFSFTDEDVAGIPIVCFGPEGLSREPKAV